jgi:CheY-like chemotaxis protein
MRILIAEDDSALASFVKKGLEAEYYAVDISPNGEHARAMAAEFDYDLLILDLGLPLLDGITVLRSLRDYRPRMPILVLTARSHRRPRAMPRLGRGRLSDKALFFRGTGGPHSRAAASKQPAISLDPYGRRP